MLIDEGYEWVCNTSGDYSNAGQWGAGARRLVPVTEMPQVGSTRVPTRKKLRGLA